MEVDYSIYIRVLVALVFGFALGLEREMTNKYAGLRTHIMVCLGACLFTILSIYGFPAVLAGTGGNGIRDTARVAAQVVTGIGFIGGGTVLRHGSSVYGLTTAATLWMAASIGMACGTGMYGLAGVSTIASIIVLVSVRFFEESILISSTKNTKRIKLNICAETENANSIYDHIINKYKKIIEISKKPNKSDERFSKINAVIEITSRKPVKDLYKAFQNVEGVESISIQDCNEIIN